MSFLSERESQEVTRWRDAGDEKMFDFLPGPSFFLVTTGAEKQSVQSSSSDSRPWLISIFSHLQRAVIQTDGTSYSVISGSYWLSK